MKNVWKKFVAAALLCVGAHAGAAPILSIDTGSGSAQLGATVDFTIGIADVADLYGYQFTLNYDARYLRLLGGAEGGFLATGGNTYGDLGDASQAGTISYVFNSLISAVPGVSGSGALATFSFETIGVGSAALSFADVIFLDSDLEDIALGVQNAQFTVLDVPSEVPEPASILLIGAGLAGVAALRRRRPVVPA